MKMLIAMILEVNSKRVSFDKLPPLDRILSSEVQYYKLTTYEGETILRKVSCSNIIYDLYLAIEVLGPSGLYHFTQDLTESELQAASVMPTVANLIVRNAWCYYDLATRPEDITTTLKALYPDRLTCAAALNISKFAANGSTQGDIALINRHIAVADHYLTGAELTIRYKTNLRRGNKPMHVYAYDYNGEHVGSFRSVADAARALCIDSRCIRRSILTPDRMQEGYYFYDNPDSRPPLNIDKTV